MLSGGVFATRTSRRLALLQRVDTCGQMSLIGDLGEDGVMVAGGVAAVGLDPDLGGAVDGLVGVYAALVGCPVAIGEHAVGIDTEAGRNEDVVDAFAGLGIGVKVDEGAILGKANARMGVAVVEDAALAESAVNLVGLVDIEVTGEDDWCAPGDGADALYHQLGRLAPRSDSHMIHVEVEEVEGESPLAHLELAPRADTSTNGIPAVTDLFGRLAEPERATVEQPHAVFFIEDAGVLARLLAIVAAHARVVVAVELLEHVDELGMRHLLGSEGIGCLKVHLVAHHLAARAPHLALLLVALDQQADVVGAHHQVFLRHGSEGDCHDGHQSEDSFHHSKVLLVY